MNTSTMTLVVGFVRWWVRVYTSGLSSEVRDARRAEIESDLWEHDRHNGDEGYAPDETAWQAFSRWLLGIPSDLSWRVEQIGAARRVGKPNKSERRGNVNTSGAQKALLALAVLLALGFVVGGVAGIASTDSASQYYTEDMILGILGISGAAIFITGLYITRWWPSSGSILVVAGAMPMGFSIFWLVVPPILAALLAWFGVARALRFARRSPV